MIWDKVEEIDGGKIFTKGEYSVRVTDTVDNGGAYLEQSAIKNYKEYYKEFVSR